MLGKTDPSGSCTSDWPTIGCTPARPCPSTPDASGAALPETTCETSDAGPAKASFATCGSVAIEAQSPVALFRFRSRTHDGLRFRTGPRSSASPREAATSHVKSPKDHPFPHPLQIPAITIAAIHVSSNLRRFDLIWKIFWKPSVPRTHVPRWGTLHMCIRCAH